MRFDERNGSSVLERSFKLLDAFGPSDYRLSLADLAERTGLPKPTALRLARQLVEVGALDRQGSYYAIGMKLFELGSSVWRQQRLRNTALPYMEDLYEATHEVVHLGVLSGYQVLYLEKIGGPRSIKLGTRVGSRRPLYCTGLGKVMLAYAAPRFVEEVAALGMPPRTPYTVTDPRRLKKELASIMKAGVALDREEAALGVACVAAPLVNRDGGCRVALSVTGSTTSFDPERHAGAVRMAALAITRSLQGNPWPSE